MKSLRFSDEPIRARLLSMQQRVKIETVQLLRRSKAAVYTPKELGDHFGLHYSTVSGIIKPDDQKSKTLPINCLNEPDVEKFWVNSQTLNL